MVVVVHDGGACDKGGNSSCGEDGNSSDDWGVSSDGDNTGIESGGGSSDGGIGGDYRGDSGHFCIKFYNLCSTFT